MAVSLCGYCGELFNSLEAFRKHRVKRQMTGGSASAVFDCLTAEQMMQKGMQRNNRGRWISKPMKVEVRPVFVAGPRRKSPDSSSASSTVDPTAPDVI